ncbi:Nucleotidyl transferase of uncharacterised function (DUF1814) [Mycobacteroides abscessus subsp. abscessus]|nr:Nucleotidyl transferase of uncharacterised function (DUF1814) [Mycobacteroides abscessus subsp. abscessus]
MSDSYQSWPAIAAAIKDTAKRNTATDLNMQISQAMFDRFLSRVFSAGEDSEWLLKGGTSMLARIPTARATTDVDLAATVGTLDDATDALAEVASRDIGDHISFQITSAANTGLGDNQPGVDTRRLLFTATAHGSAKPITKVPVDLVVSSAPVGQIQTITPANRLHLPRPLPVSPYRLYPMVDHIADKVCATMMTYPGGRPSSRVKDLVDLALIARTQSVDLDQLRLAIATKRTLSKMDDFTHFTIPDGWQSKYRLMASRVPALADDLDITHALGLVTAMIDPALTPPTNTARQWNHHTAGWTETVPAEPDPVLDDTKTVHVRTHTRAGQLISEHRRTPRNT